MYYKLNHASCLSQDLKFNQISYSLKGIDMGLTLFDVDSVTGQITLKDNADLTKEADSEYTVSILFRNYFSLSHTFLFLLVRDLDGFSVKFHM